MYNIRKGNVWQVRDNEGVIFDGGEHEMHSAFLAIATEDEDNEYYVETWYPPLELVKVVLVSE